MRDEHGPLQSGGAGEARYADRILAEHATVAVSTIWTLRMFSTSEGASPDERGLRIICEKRVGKGWGFSQGIRPPAGARGCPPLHRTFGGRRM